MSEQSNPRKPCAKCNLNPRHRNHSGGGSQYCDECLREILGRDCLNSSTCAEHVRVPSMSEISDDDLTIMAHWTDPTITRFVAEVRRLRAENEALREKIAEIAALPMESYNAVYDLAADVRIVLRDEEPK